MLVFPHAYLVVHVSEQVSRAALCDFQALELVLGARNTRCLFDERRQKQRIFGDALEHREQQVRELQPPAQRVAQRILREQSQYRFFSLTCSCMTYYSIDVNGYAALGTSEFFQSGPRLLSYYL